MVTLQFLGPLALALAGARRRLDLAWAATAGTGVALITGGPAGGETVGVLLALGAAAMTMATLILSRRLATVSSGLDEMAVAVTVGACVTLPLAVPAAFSAAAAHELALVAAVAVLGLVVLASSGVMATRR